MSTTSLSFIRVKGLGFERRTGIPILSLDKGLLSSEGTIRHGTRSKDSGLIFHYFVRWPIVSTGVLSSRDLSITIGV